MNKLFKIKLLVKFYVVTLLWLNFTVSSALANPNVYSPADPGLLICPGLTDNHIKCRTVLGYWAWQESYNECGIEGRNIYLRFPISSNSLNNQNIVKNLLIRECRDDPQCAKQYDCGYIEEVDPITTK